MANNINCPTCWPPYPLRPSGWATPEYYCYRCKEYYDSNFKVQPKPEINQNRSGGLILESDEEDIYDQLYIGALIND